MIIIISLIINYNSYGIDFVIIDVENFINIPMGTEVTEIGAEYNPYGLLSAFPEKYNNKNMIINDYANLRFSIYDLNFNFLYSIDYDDNTNYWAIDYYLLTLNHNIIAYSPITEELIKLSSKGERLYTISRNKLPKSISKNWDVWLYNDFLLFYDDNGIPGYINPNGEIIKNREALTFFNKIKEGSVFRNDSTKFQQIDQFLFDNNIILSNNELILSSKHNKLSQYFNFMKVSNYENVNRILKLIEPYKSGSIIGFDIAGNCYISLNIQNEYFYLVINSSANMLISFKANIPSRKLLPNGDIYGRKFNRELKQYEFYKIENTWDPEAKRLWQEKQNTNLIKNLSTTSLLTEPKDKNAYHPVKLFDNNPKTMWIENTKGPGIGEKISFSFAKDITIDKITFQPGCFWDKYWKQNNRVKKIRMKLDDKNYTLDFDDEMKDQGITFNETISFSEVELIIEAVYKTTKWDDTAISGIKFYLNGEEIKIDTSKFAEGFEVKK